MTADAPWLCYEFPIKSCTQPLTFFICRYDVTLRCDVMQLQVITDEHLRHLVAMATDETPPDSAAQVDEMLDTLNQFHSLSAVSGCFLLIMLLLTIALVSGGKPHPVPKLVIILHVN